MLRHTWAVGTLALWVLAWARSTGARIGWILMGAATVWMVWSATPEVSRPIAAGTAVLAWSLLSIPALRGAWNRNTFVHVTNQIPVKEKQQ